MTGGFVEHFRLEQARGDGPPSEEEVAPPVWWPLPPPGSLRVFIEWPVAAIELSSAELACAPLGEAAARSQRLWSD